MPRELRAATRLFVFVKITSSQIHVEAHFPWRSLVESRNSRRKTVLWSSDIQWHNYTRLCLVAYSISRIMLVSDDTFAHSNLLQVDVFLNLIFAIEFLAFDFKISKLVHVYYSFFRSQPASLFVKTR